MRLIRYVLGNRDPRYGWIWEGKVGPLEGTPFGEYRRLEADVALEEVRLLAPLQPQKIICIAYNYSDPMQQVDSDLLEMPMLFLKPPSAVIGSGESIIIPPQSKLVEHAAQLAVVIGKSGRWIPTERAMEHVLGYTAANDITARDLQYRDGQWARSKSFDTFCPLGPWIETDLDPTDIRVSCRVNDELRQIESTHQMVFTISQLIAFVSSVMTLQPGDVLLTGSPPGSGPLVDGDVVSVDIDGIGVMTNPVSGMTGIAR